MYWIGVDLGSTNIKAGLYDDGMKCVRMESVPVVYDRSDGHVEFDAAAYGDALIETLKRVANGEANIGSISFTGQAESLVVLGEDGKPLMNAISWMDERSMDECDAMDKVFPTDACYAVTGQTGSAPTWPATKILWLRTNRPEIFNAAKHYVLLKDYIVYRLTGKLVSDMSIATFTFYFDIYNKCYWKDMLDYIGISEAQVPPLVEPCTVAGTLTDAVAKETGMANTVSVNVGTLDHFAGMVGTGNVQSGDMNLSTGTVMCLATMATTPVRRDTGIPMHYGFLPDSYVMLAVAESGGVSLEWFKRNLMKDVSYDEMNRVLAEREKNDLVFLPYIVGVNCPEFDRDASGLFFGLRQKHDAIDMAGAVMEGVAHLLRRNCDFIRSSGTPINRIIATGGGARSAIWCQMQADITGIPVVIPAEKEAACLGAAMIGAVAGGRFASYKAASDEVVRIERTFEPQPSAFYERKHKQFDLLYDAAMQAVKLD